ncbi:hypothetical protein COB18_03485 [Candidatus Kaiserbacteria bacterium]|nr:MAG: hypothetical protein COB18_03485 [Candidatus Kaiserbacteria bacterium]
MKFRALSTRGTGLIEVVVGAALLVTIFVGFFGVLQLGTRLATDNKSRTGALALASERMEFLRSLDYDDIGTLSDGDGNNGHGNDPGDDPSNPGGGAGVNSDGFTLFSTYFEDITLNNVNYTRRTMVAYYDDPADGTGGQDENNKKNDYKVMQVSVYWSNPNGERKVVLVSNAAPIGIEE